MHKSNSSPSTWYPLKEYPKYEINKAGQIRNALTGKLRKADHSNSSFACILLFDSNGKAKHAHIDKLVADTFLTNKDPNRFDTLKHIDGDPYNCSVDNLIWDEDERSQQKTLSEYGIVKPKEYYEFYPLSEFPDSIYEINKMGQVRNKNTHKLLKGGKRTGYLGYTLYIDRKIVYRMAHIMVAQQFIPNPENKPIVNHIDENKSNPCIDNLEWVTASENSKYGKAQERTNIARNKPINEYNLQGDYIRTWRSLKSIADFYETIYPQEKVLDALGRSVRINSRKDTTKRVFCNRIFLQYDVDFKNKDFTISRSKVKYNANIFDELDQVIPKEYLIDPDELNINYIDVLKSLKTFNISLSYQQKQAIDYAIKCIKKVQKINNTRPRS